MSIVLIKPMKIADAELIPLVAGVAMVKALQNRGMNPKTEMAVSDILIEDKKCGEVFFANQERSNNLTKFNGCWNWSKCKWRRDNDFPKEIRPDASSIFYEHR